MFAFIVNHLLGHIPTWIWPFVAGAGFATFIIAGIAQHIAPIKLYATIARPISVVVMIVGVFFYGGAGVLDIQAQALQEAEKRIAVAEQASADANKALSDNLVSQASATTGRGKDIHQTIKQDKAKINADCKRIDDQAWADYNRAVKNGLTK